MESKNMINRRVFFKRGIIGLTGMLTLLLTRKDAKAKAVSDEIPKFEGDYGWCLSGGQLFAWRKDGTLKRFPKKRAGVYMLSKKSSEDYLNYYKESKDND
jgi:3'-phosphoadenosine 5'-phosphosulfate sulfotransferase